jgi:hypothetical protein
MSCRTNCCKTLVLVTALLAMAIMATPAFAQNCIQNEYNLQQGVSATGTTGSTKLNCTANDVRIAKVQNVRDPVTGNPITTCVAGNTFSFLADFEILTTSSQARENIGLYISTSSQTQALTGSCTDHIISAQHPCTTNTSLSCGSDNYHETDAAPDNCGDTSSGDFSGTFGAGAEKVTLEIDNFLCQAPAGSNQVQLPNCTSWQIPGGTIQCVSPSPDTYPFNGPGATPTAVPGTKSKCNCGIIPLGVTVQSPTVTVGKTCNTNDNTGTPDFTVSPPTPNACTISPEGGQVVYTVNVVNTSNFGNIVIDQVCDTAYGTVYRSATPVPANLAACAAGSQTGVSITSTTCNSTTLGNISTSGQCTFTVTQAENITVDNVASVSGHGASNGTFGPSSSNQVEVISGENPSTATVTKSVVATEAACATERFAVDVHNTSSADETLTLSALNDSAFGNLTQCTNTNCANNSGANASHQILGTNCGLAAGIGTLANVQNAGGGAFSTLAPDAHYTCEFDGQFCSALSNGCISDTDQVTPTLAGDENEAVSTTHSTSLTVKECLTQTVTTQ